MTTLVGTQSEFLKAIKELIELDYDAIAAYEAAIDRVEHKVYKEHLKSFRNDHEEHVRDLNKILEQHREKKVDGPSAKQWITKGKVMIANMLGDKTIIGAMIDNEEDTNVAYERLNAHKAKWPEAEKALKKGLEDERRHKKWLQDNQYLSD